MPKKKQLLDELKEGKAADTQAATAEVWEELRAEIAQEPELAPDPVRGFVAYSDFEIDGRSYKAGDTFTPPDGWEIDRAFDEMRGIILKNKGGKQIGTAFIVPGELNKKTKEREYRREVLPVKEA